MALKNNGKKIKNVINVLKKSQKIKIVMDALKNIDKNKEKLRQKQ